MPYELYWLLPSETPTINNGTIVIVESLNGTMYVDFIGPDFYSWGDDIVRWAYFPDEKYASFQNELSDATKHYKEENEELKKLVDDWHNRYYSDVEFYKKENEKLKKLVDDWFNKYLDLLDKRRNEHQRDAFAGKRSKFAIDDNCGSVNSDGDECPATDDLCGVCKSDDARSVSEVSINELRDIFLKVMREARERERAEEDDD